jgi:GNAT superfamily N-acetyltransferase
VTRLPSGVRLRAATPDDAKAGSALHRACWQEAYGPYAAPHLLAAAVADHADWERRWHQQLTGGPPRQLAVHEGAGGEELLGFAVVGTSRDPDLAAGDELYALYVREQWWGTGIGQALLDAVLGAAACSLWVLEDNSRARRFYQRNGFVPDGSRELYERLGTWEVRLVRT